MTADTVSNANDAAPVGKSVQDLLGSEVAILDIRLAGLSGLATLLRHEASVENIDEIIFLGDELAHLTCEFRDWLDELRKAAGVAAKDRGGDIISSLGQDPSIFSDVATAELLKESAELQLVNQEQLAELIRRLPPAAEPVQ